MGSRNARNYAKLVFGSWDKYVDSPLVLDTISRRSVPSNSDRFLSHLSPNQAVFHGRYSADSDILEDKICQQFVADELPQNYG